MLFRLAFLAFLAAAGPVRAEGVIADPAATSACSKASGLASPSVSAPIRFSDVMGRSAMILSGIKPGAKAGGRPETKLCLYDRHSGKAETQGMAAWSAPPKR